MRLVQSRSWRPKLSYMKMWPKCPWSLTLPHYLFSPSLYLQAHGWFPTISWQRKRKLRLGLQMVLHDMQAQPESGQLWYYSLFLGHLWRIVVKKKSSLWAEIQAVHQVVYSAWKEKLPDIRLYTNSSAMVHSLTRSVIFNCCAAVGTLTRCKNF